MDGCWLASCLSFLLKPIFSCTLQNTALPFSCSHILNPGLPQPTARSHLFAIVQVLIMQTPGIHIPWPQRIFYRASLYNSPQHSHSLLSQPGTLPSLTIICDSLEMSLHKGRLQSRSFLSRSKASHWILDRGLDSYAYNPKF